MFSFAGWLWRHQPHDRPGQTDRLDVRDLWSARHSAAHSDHRQQFRGVLQKRAAARAIGREEIRAGARAPEGRDYAISEAKWRNRGKLGISSFSG